jgi:hypothetical protein
MTDPATSSTDKFVLPASSSKILKDAMREAIKSAFEMSSSCVTPRRTSNPFPILETRTPSITTDASVTRWSQAFTKKFLCLFLMLDW